MNQIQRNIKKIKKFESNYGPHEYSQTEFKEITGNRYIKSYYDVLLDCGKIIPHQWPNAGKIGGYSDNIKIKLSNTHPTED